MGDSACLMQPFSYTSGIPNEANEGNPIHALGQSISFGRFMSESLAWEKWSTFSHNRYVEEAERYSRPGSVAQKKAFFEAHYKKIAAQKAAALLEQANAASNNETAEEEVANNISPHDSEIVIPNSNEVIDQQHVVATPYTAAYAFVNDNEYGSNAEKGQFENRMVDGADLVPEKHVFMVNSLEVEQSNQLRDVDNHKLAEMELGGTPEMEKPLLRSSNSNQDSLASMSKKKPSLSSSSSLIHGRATKVPSSPAKDMDPICPKKDNNATPMIMKSAIHSADKKKSTPKSHYKSVNFTPIREINRLTSKVIRKIESSRPGAISSKTSKDCLTPLKTPTTVSKNEVRRHPSATPWSAERRARTPLDPSASERTKVSQKWRLLPTENKMQSPILSTPFSFRTEERAARRKKICISLPFLPCCFQKLEDKFNANDAQKVQLQTKIKEKAETEIRKLRQSLCFKARPLPSFYKERKEQQNEMNKMPLAHPQSPKLGRKPTRIMAESTSSLPPQRPSIKRSGSKHLHGKDSQTPTRTLTPQSIVDTHENTSPNIQMDSHSHKYRT
ncbi:protein WVD2-like 7 isoform X2 [Carya illinoinensis]|uniref:protein WVD2-like 7 isoform X2 n=1 Tax=Carya illinoinensis TaxID=32201 RepID=UPI001C724F6D|nr:protein WVD2-like 7 isoform X2 [Carya illinoinensis]